jgi:SNF2 family DNA or RNA helicase
MEVLDAIEQAITELEYKDPVAGELYKLRPYQQEFLRTKAPHYDHIGTFDEMGVGKTIQLIALDHVRRLQVGDNYGRSTGKNKTLVVAPLTGVIDQWVQAFHEWCPWLEVRRVDAKDAKTRGAFLDKEADVYIIHPEGLRLEKDKLKKVKWLHMIFDEVHKIKNRQAKTTKAAKEVGLSARYRSCGTGTPMENQAHEAWSIFSMYLYPNKAEREKAGLTQWTKKLLNSYWRFYGRFVEYYEDPETGYHTITGVLNSDEFKRLFGPFYIRRLKSEVIKDLPPKQYTTIEVDLLPKQRRAYDEMKRELIAWVGEREDQPVVAAIAIAQMVRLQQFTLGYGSTEYVTLNKRDGTKERKLKVTLEEPSAKLDALLAILEDLGDAQAIVFSTSKQAVDMAARRLRKAEIPAAVITGDTMQSRRKRNLSDFQKGEVKVLCMTIRAGGVGMNLQHCSNVIFLDRDWSPAKNQQAEDRSHRLGQKNPVNIIDIVARKTIDQKKDRTIKKKWEWIKEMVGA